MIYVNTIITRDINAKTYFFSIFMNFELYYTLILTVIIVIYGESNFLMLKRSFTRRKSRWFKSNVLFKSENIVRKNYRHSEKGSFYIKTLRLLLIQIMLIFGGTVLRINVVQPIDDKHVPVVPRERFWLIPFYSVRTHGNVVRAKRLTVFRHTQKFIGPYGSVVNNSGGRLLLIRHVRVVSRRSFVQIKFAFR